MLQYLKTQIEAESKKVTLFPLDHYSRGRISAFQQILNRLEGAEYKQFHELLAQDIKQAFASNDTLPEAA